MNNLLLRWRGSAPYLLSLLRIIAAFLFIQVGSAKVLGVPGAVMPGGGTAAITTQVGFAGLLEIVGGSLMLLGLFTRATAFVLSGEMAFAYFIGHAPMGFWPVLNQGTDAILYCFLWLYFSAAGAGPWSLDAVLFDRHADVDLPGRRSSGR
jgi:putative oxidoreductase